MPSDFVKYMDCHGRRSVIWELLNETSEWEPLSSKCLFKMLHAWLLQGFSLPEISKLIKLSISQRISTAYSSQGPARSEIVSLLYMSPCATLRSGIKFAIHCHALGVTTDEQVSPCHNCTYRRKVRQCETGLSYHPMLRAMSCIL